MGANQSKRRRDCPSPSRYQLTSAGAAHGPVVSIESPNVPSGALPLGSTLGPESTSEHPLLQNDLIANHNWNLNMVSGPAAIANNNPNLNVLASPGATVHYAPITSINLPAYAAPNAIQSAIAKVLKERYVPGAVYDAQLGTGCMHGTRVIILQDIENWIRNPNAPQIFWLAGMAGTGKTAIAWTVCSRLREHSVPVLCASFFCSRSAGSVAQRDVRCVIPTLAQLLALQSTEFSEALAEELARDPDVLHKQIGAQVKQLLYKPLLALKESQAPIVFVIDALDECGDQSTSDEMNNADSHRVVSEMLQALVDFSRSAVKLPVKFMVTSRPETHIRDTPVSDATFSTVLHLHTVNKDQVSSDIRLYIATRLSSSPRLRARFTADDVDMLARLCDGLFIAATTTLQHVLGAGIDAAPSKFKTLLNSAQDGLSSGAAVPLDRMYNFILTDATGATHSSTEELQEMLRLLASLLSTRVTLSLVLLADLLDMDKDEVRARLSRLHAVVHVPEDDADQSLRTLHASFGDYLFSRAPTNIRISESFGHEVLARACLRTMAMRLHFNVSQTISSHELNPAVLCDKITWSLEYACLQWVYHIAAVSASAPSALDAEIDAAFRMRFLFWLEVASVLGQVGRAAAMLFAAAATVRLPELRQFLRDAHAFVVSSGDVIEGSASHIYISALPFAAKDSLVYRTFVPLCTGLIGVDVHGIDRHVSRLVMTLTGHEGTVTSVAYSPDGRWIVSGSNDGTVRIWNTLNGEQMSSPLRVGDDPVWSVAFAPNGKSIAAGTEDGVVYIWHPFDAMPPWRLIGHSSAVKSIAFSPDGDRIASASFDRTIRLWRAETGQQASILYGHGNAVTDVAFSPDGATLASCSNNHDILVYRDIEEGSSGQLIRQHMVVISICFTPDGTKLASRCPQFIKLWDLQTGMLVATLPNGSDGSSVRSIQFFAEELSLASVFDDHSIRLWNVLPDMAESRSILLKGHTGYVFSVAFAPNRMYVASASADGTIRIWNSAGDKQAIKPLPAHEGPVRSVAASPDGNLILSAAEDCLVRGFDVETGELRLGPLRGHTNIVYSVAMASSGHLIASASADGTVRIWDARTGKAVNRPLRGHIGSVNAVAFSRDSRLVASGSDDCTVRIWEAETGQNSGLKDLKCAGKVYTVAFSSDGGLLAAGDGIGRIHLWHPDTGQRACESLHASDRLVRCVEFSCDGNRIVSGAEDGTIRVWNVSTRLSITLEDRSNAVSSVAFSPDGQLICGSSDQTVRIWNASTGALFSTLHGHTGRVSSVAFMPNGRSVISGSFDKTIRVWNLATAHLPSSAGHKDPINTLESATLKNAWLVGPSGELLLWVPSEYREYLQILPCEMRIDHHRIAVTVGTDGWHHGTSWTSCWRTDAPSTVSGRM